MEVCLCRVASVGMVHLVVGTEQSTWNAVDARHYLEIVLRVYLCRGHVLFAHCYLGVVHQLHHGSVMSTAGV